MRVQSVLTSTFLLFDHHAIVMCMGFIPTEFAVGNIAGGTGVATCVATTVSCGNATTTRLRLTGTGSWNYPFHNLFNPISASLFAGNAIVIKVSEYASWSIDYYKVAHLWKHGSMQ